MKTVTGTCPPQKRTTFTSNPLHGNAPLPLHCSVGVEVITDLVSHFSRFGVVPVPRCYPILYRMPAPDSVSLLLYRTSFRVSRKLCSTMLGAFLRTQVYMLIQHPKPVRQDAESILRHPSCSTQAIVEDALVIGELSRRAWLHRVGFQAKSLIPYDDKWHLLDAAWQRAIFGDAERAIFQCCRHRRVPEHTCDTRATIRSNMHDNETVRLIHDRHQHDAIEHFVVVES